MRILIALSLLVSSAAFSEIRSISEDQRCKPESDVCSSTLTIKLENSAITLDNLVGPFYLSKVNDQVFDCGGNVLARDHYSHLISSSGNKKKIEHLDGIADCGITEDQKLYWIAYEKFENNSIYPLLRVFNSNAQIIFERKAKFKSSVGFEYQGIKYHVYLPDIP